MRKDKAKKALRFCYGVCACDYFVVSLVGPIQQLSLEAEWCGNVGGRDDSQLSHQRSEPNNMDAFATQQVSVTL